MMGDNKSRSRNQACPAAPQQQMSRPLPVWIFGSVFTQEGPSGPFTVHTVEGNGKEQKPAAPFPAAHPHL
jgi:hypothetical protein